MYLLLPHHLKYRECWNSNTIVSARSEKVCLLKRKRWSREGYTALISSLSLRKSKKGFQEHKTELISGVNSNSKVLYAWECYQKTSTCADISFLLISGKKRMKNVSFVYAIHLILIFIINSFNPNKWLDLFLQPSQEM